MIRFDASSTMATAQDLGIDADATVSVTKITNGATVTIQSGNDSVSLQLHHSTVEALRAALAPLTWDTPFERL